MTGYPPAGGLAGADPSLSWWVIDADLLEAARRWLAAPSYTQERDYLAGHPELLAPAADSAVEEALREVPADEAERFRMLRETAREDGVEAAYQPMMLMLLAQEFADADLAGQRRLLTEHTDDLCSDIVGAALEELAERDQTGRAQEGSALRTLALLGQHEPVLDALDDPAQFYDLLARLATLPDLSALGPAVAIAFTAVSTSTGAATAAFFFAVVLAAEGDEDQAQAVLTEARYIAPERAEEWAETLARIGRLHPIALDLVPLLHIPLPGEGAVR
ncbi:MAG TPA: hypothetical protein VLJ59_02080 [Mycobacteriales bacterium]|nr:hypothetical protein [Mycobacteriales bacterium]